MFYDTWQLTNISQNRVILKDMSPKYENCLLCPKFPGHITFQSFSWWVPCHERHTQTGCQTCQNFACKVYEVPTAISMYYMAKVSPTLVT